VQDRPLSREHLPPDPRAVVAIVTDRLISLAAGTILDVDPATAVSVAAAAGFPAVGIWHDPSTWVAQTARDVAQRLADTGVIALDVEPIIFGRGDYHGEAVIEIAAALDARFVLVASGPAPVADVVDALARLCELAAVTAPGVTLVLEFLPIFSVGSLAAAVEAVRAIGAPNLGVLVDTLHLDRSGSTPADLAADLDLFPYLQLADAPRLVDSSPRALRDEALHGRLLPGDGVLPLAEVLAAVPGVPISVELRSRALIERYPAAVDRARAVLTAIRRVVENV
jgi:sugar phosphate isomerase/epimerase